MTNNLKVLPGELNLEIFYGDDCSFKIDLGIDLGDFELEGSIVGPSEHKLSIGELDLKKGQIILSLTGEETKLLYKHTHWFLKSTRKLNGDERTILAGKFSCKTLEDLYK